MGEIQEEDKDKKTNPAIEEAQRQLQELAGQDVASQPDAEIKRLEVLTPDQIGKMSPEEIESASLAVEKNIAPIGREIQRLEAERKERIKEAIKEATARITAEITNETAPRIDQLKSQFSVPREVESKLATAWRKKTGGEDYSERLRELKNPKKRTKK